MGNPLAAQVGRIIVAVVLGAVLLLAYLAYQKGWFEPRNQYVLVTAKATNLKPGMPVEVAGIAIGTVQAVDLGDDGNVRVMLAVPRKHAKWVRSDSVFVLEQPLLGASRIAVGSGDMKNPPLPDKAVRRLVINSSLDNILAQADVLLGRVQAITNNFADPKGAFNQTLAHLEKLTGKMEQRGIVEALTNDRNSAAALNATLVKSQEVTAGLDLAIRRADNLLATVHERLGKPGGTLDKTDEILREAVGTLQDTRRSLNQVKALLDHSVKISANAAESTENLAALRQRVDAAVRKTDLMLDELHQRWPFARQREVTLP